MFILVFAYFKVARRYQHGVLFWGIIGAVLMRGVFILVGVNVIARFHWVLYLFGAFHCLHRRQDGAASTSGTSTVDPEHNFAVRMFRKYFPLSGPRSTAGIFARHENPPRRHARPLSC